MPYEPFLLGVGVVFNLLRNQLQSLAILHRNRESQPTSEKINESLTIAQVRVAIRNRRKSRDSGALNSGISKP